MGSDLPFKKTERVLNKLFRYLLGASNDFNLWLLSKTKFVGVRAELVNEPWEFRWYQSPATKVQSETDIFLLFKCLDCSRRFAFHIENKLAKGKFENNQPQLYHERARDWMTTHDYADYESILIAPLFFYEKYRSKADIFHRYIPHEEIADFIPQFAV